jgi:hypothetical protein
VKGLPDLSLTFSSYNEAEFWAAENEQEYISNPDKYQNWLSWNRKSQKENGIFHSHRPLDSF